MGWKHFLMDFVLGFLFGQKVMDFFWVGGGGGLPSGLNDFSGVCFNFVGLFRSKNLTSFTPLCH